MLAAEKLFQFLFQIISDGIVIEKQIDGVILDIIVAHIPSALIVASLAPGVLHYVVFPAILVFGNAIYHHYMVITGIPTVKPLLPGFLCCSSFWRICA